MRQRDVGTSSEASSGTGWARRLRLHARWRPRANRLAPPRAAAVRVWLRRAQGLPRLLAVTGVCAAAWAGVASGAALSLGGKATAQQPAASRPPALGRWLAGTFEDAKARDAFVPELRRLLAQIRRRLRALNALATRYPSSAPAGAATGTATGAATRAATRAARSGDGPDVDRQVRLHCRALRSQLEALDVHVAVLFGSTGRPLPGPLRPADWRRRSQAATTAAATLETLVEELLTHDDLPADDREVADLETRLTQAFANLWDILNAEPSQPVTAR